MQRGCLPLPEFYSWEPPKGDLNPDLTPWSCLCHWEGPRSGSGLGLHVGMRTVRGLASVTSGLGLLSRFLWEWGAIGRTSTAAPADPCLAWSPGPRHVGDAGDGLGCG